MKHNRMICPAPHVIKDEARKILSVRANRLCLIEAICLCFLIIPLYYMLYTALGVLSVMIPSIPILVMEWIWIAVLIFLTLLLTLPLLHGLFLIAEKMERGEEAVLADLFWSFTSGSRYLSALASSWRVIWIAVFFLFAANGVFGLAREIFVDGFLASLIGALLGIPTILIGISVWMGRFPEFAATLLAEHNPQGARRLLEHPSPIRRYVAKEFWRGFVFPILLGILTVGILLVLDVLPKMLIAYFRYCRYMNDNDDYIGGMRNE